MRNCNALVLSEMCKRPDAFRRCTGLLQECIEIQMVARITPVRLPREVVLEEERSTAKAGRGRTVAI